MLQVTVDWLLYDILGLDASSLAVQALNFFLYDSVKIILLIFVMIAFVGFLRTYLPQEKIRGLLGKKRRVEGNIFASLFGAITPFCSCSSIPIFLGFLEAGIPLGTTFSFLVTSPLINEYLVVLMLGFFGWKITVLYVISGLLIGIVSGMILGRMNLEKYLVKDVVSKKSVMGNGLESVGIKGRISYGIKEASSITRKIWLWVLLGVGIGALIHNYVPEELIHGLIESGGIFTVPVATVVGVPMYGSCAAIIPIAVVLFSKGIPLGTALAFMMATAALSLPEAIILRRAMRLELIAIFFATVTVSIIATGYLFNFLEPLIV